MAEENIVPRYKIINSKNKDYISLIPEVVEDMSRMNIFDHLNKEDFTVQLLKNLKSPNFLLCLAFKENDFVGFAYGEISGKTFQVDRFFVKTRMQYKNIGTMLLAHLYGYVRDKHKVMNIKMISYPGTNEINKKLTGKKEITIIKEGKPTEVFRSFKNSSFSYNLKKSKIIDKGDNGPFKTRDSIHINKNAYMKKREIRSRAK